MLTNEAHTELVTLAGPAFTWQGVPASRPQTDIRTGLFAFLADYSGGLCAFCGEGLGDGWQACHIVSAGPMRRGYVAQNLAAGCSDCNEADRQNGPIVAYETIMRPDLIPSEWPTNKELVALGKQRKAEVEARRNAKSERRGM